MALLTQQFAYLVGKELEWNVSNLELQKILYITHMFYLGQNEKPLLIGEMFQAWDYGPVLPTLYHTLKDNKSEKINKKFGKKPTNQPEQLESDCISELTKTLKNFSSGKLVSITHRVGSAWDKYYVPNKNNIIPTEAISKEYIDFYK